MSNGRARHPRTLIEVLQTRAERQPDRPAYIVLPEDGGDPLTLTYGDVARRSLALATELRTVAAEGDRALLLYPPGADYVTAFFACLQAGLVAVPAYPPLQPRLLARLETIVADAEATLALTTSPFLSLAQTTLDGAGRLATLRWMTTDAMPGARPVERTMATLGSEDPAFLQYTSGSTEQARGVTVTHANLLDNLALIVEGFQLDADHVGVSWLPPYHDLGLIGGILVPLYAGFRCVLMSPLAFLRRPTLWLETITRYRGTISGGPNFAYDLCVRKVTPDERGRLDLRSWAVACNAAEPVRADTLDRFAATFVGCGFRRRAFSPCYGLAEATLVVSGGRPAVAPTVATVERASLEENRVVPAEAGGAATALVACGRPLGTQQVAIVDPRTEQRCAPDAVGEIWVKGPSVTGGYWRRRDDTQRTFRAVTADGDGPYLRTGDLGFLRDGELFVTGRLKAVIVSRGRNHYAHDIVV